MVTEGTPRHRLSARRKERRIFERQVESWTAVGTRSDTGQLTQRLANIRLALAPRYRTELLSLVREAYAVSPVTECLLRSSGRLYSILQVWHEPEVAITNC